MLSKFFLDRPVFAWVIAIVIMVLGGLAIYNLPVAQYPPIAPPSIAIQCLYSGASAETVEDSVTQIIEQQMVGLDRMLYLSASSDAAGLSRIELTFAPGTDPDLDWGKVQNKLQLAMAGLPASCAPARCLCQKIHRNYLMVAGLVSDDGRLDAFRFARLPDFHDRKSVGASTGSRRSGRIRRSLCHAHLAQSRQAEFI